MAESVSIKSDIKKDIRRMFYKNPIKKDNLRLELDYWTPQEERRQTLLELQKKSRNEIVNAARGILQEKFFSELEDEEPMDVEKCTSKPKSYKRGNYRGHRMMMSEWMLDVPQDFLENWIMVPCPTGKRTTLIAAKGITKAYSRKGWLMATFHSALPGGNSNANRHHYTVLDCIWMENQKQYYALDVIAWGNQPITNCDAEFRLSWIDSKMFEIEQLKERDTETNKYPILPLSHINCYSDLNLALTDFNDLHPLDGLLFYHRNAHYTFGYTPLVLWLKVYMLSEVLGLFVPSPHDERPEEYIDYKHYIYQTTKHKRKREYLQALWNL